MRVECWLSYDTGARARAATSADGEGTTENDDGRQTTED